MAALLREVMFLRKHGLQRFGLQRFGLQRFGLRRFGAQAAGAAAKERVSTMIRTGLAAVACAVTLGFATPAAHAASSQWFESEGGSMRLLVTERDGVVRGTLEIVLKPGWKTYWLNPGDGGIAPSLTLGGTEAGIAEPVELRFPAPAAINAGGVAFAGYASSVSFPFELQGSVEGAPLTLTAFVGVCAEICIPFEATAELTPDARDARPIDAAFAALPLAATTEFGVTGIVRQAGELLISVAAPADAELFLAPAKGLVIKPPVPTAGGFSAVIFRANPDGSRKIRYVLKDKRKSVEGVFELPD
jgi:DsbC/DsbD-like thiol-disulfide interchange protein